MISELATHRMHPLRSAQRPFAGDVSNVLDGVGAEVIELLAEAGYPEGFTFVTQVSSADPTMIDLVPLLIDYLAKVGVTMEIETMEYAAHLSAMTTRTHGPGYLVSTGHVNPTTTLRKNFRHRIFLQNARSSSP